MQLKCQKFTNSSHSATCTAGSPPQPKPLTCTAPNCWKCRPRSAAVVRQLRFPMYSRMNPGRTNSSPRGLRSLGARGSRGRVPCGSATFTWMGLPASSDWSSSFMAASAAAASSCGSSTTQRSTMHHRIRQRKWQGWEASEGESDSLVAVVAKCGWHKQLHYAMLLFIHRHWHQSSAVGSAIRVHVAVHCWGTQFGRLSPDLTSKVATLKHCICTPKPEALDSPPQTQSPCAAHLLYGEGRSPVLTGGRQQQQVE
jgi:hypothetical protein